LGNATRGGQWVPLAQIAPVHTQISRPQTQPVIQQPQKPALWNPEVTANLSVLFSTLFGSYLQAKNWESLGQPEKAKKSMRWFYFGIVGNCLGIFWLILWYYSSGKEQIEYVKERWGQDYIRKGWTKPVLITLSIPILIFVACTFFIMIFSYLG
jgi:hypothetical protein